MRLYPAESYGTHDQQQIIWYLAQLTTEGVVMSALATLIAPYRLHSEWTSLQTLSCACPVSIHTLRCPQMQDAFQAESSVHDLGFAWHSVCTRPMAFPPMSMHCIDLQHSKDAACSGPIQRLRRSPMAPSIPIDARGALPQAKRVLSIVMRLKTSKILFNEPVDPVTLGLDDYLDKVASPMDFGTIMSRLQQGEKAGWKKCYYSSPEEVLRDVRLVFDNCFAYNDGPGDELTRELCSEVKENFEKRWGEASLPLQPAKKSSQAPPVPAQIELIEWMSENDVPVGLSYAQGAARSYTAVYHSIFV